MYQGAVNDVEDHFVACGYLIPSRFNPADWMLRIAQRESDDELEKHGFYPMDDRTLKETTGAPAVFADPPAKDSCVSMKTELSLLFERERKSLFRNKAPMIANVSVTAFLSLVYGLFFKGVGRLDRSNQTVRSHFF